VQLKYLLMLLFLASASAFAPGSTLRHSRVRLTLAAEGAKINTIGFEADSPKVRILGV
jgi:hypothetical protein